MEAKGVCHGKLSTRTVRHSVEDRLHKLHFSWIIDNWHKALSAELKKTESALTFNSSVVTLGTTCVGVWQLGIVCEIAKGKLNYVVPHLSRRGIDEHNDECRASAVFRFLDRRSDEELWECKLTSRLKDDSDSDSRLWEFWDEIDGATLRKLARNKSIVVEATLTFRDCAYSRSFSSSAAHMSRLFDMYRTENMTDFAFVSSDNKTLRCHRLMLASSCDAFNAMLHHDTKEAKSGVCELEDVNYETLRIVIDSIYGVSVRGRIKNIPEDVYRVADKYDLRRLKDCCIEPLKTTLSLANCVDRYLFAQQYDLVGVTETVADFVRKSSKEFLESGAVRELLEKGPDLYGEFFELVGFGEYRRAKKRSAGEADSSDSSSSDSD